jgi:two-component system, OmpR family, alkaline phosphatase synthesis response regulator PhoP
MEKKKKILIVDDEPDILEFLSYNFRKNNFDVSIACNGLQGIKKMNTDKPEIIVCDILMPEMDGIEMCNEVRNNPEFSTIPFIFLTAVNDDYKVLYAMTSGADQIVSKPIRFGYLLEMVNNLLETVE